MPQVRYGGKGGEAIHLEVDPDLLAVRTHSRRSLLAGPEAALVSGLDMVLAVPEAGVEVYRRRDATAASVAELVKALSAAPDTRFAGRVLVDEQTGEPVLYTENIFVKFRDGLSAEQCHQVLRDTGLTIKDEPVYATNAYFTAAPEGTGQEVFAIAQRLLDRADVELAHPELVRAVRPAGITPADRLRLAGTARAVAEPVWRVTNAPVASSRTDDIWFRDPLRGWAVNSNGQILHTEDGFVTWQEQFHDEEVYLRCVGFASDTRGWVGTLTEAKRLFETSDGGATWTAVENLPPLAPSAVCGMSVVDSRVVYASGTNFPNVPPRMMRTLDGGASWQAWDMSEHASLLVDCLFTDADHGWVVGGKSQAANPTRGSVRAVVLRTSDGGQSWRNTVADLDAQLPLGEWGWKIQFLDERVGFVALESFTRGAILKTTDGGATWTRLEINDPQGNANLEGIGFLDENTGWVGGWGSASFEEGFSSATTDGGQNWRDANEIGAFINRFRFFHDPVTVGYASGLTVYRYATEPLPAPRHAAPPPSLRLLDGNAPRRGAPPLPITVTVPRGAATLRINIWDRFGAHVRRLLAESPPVDGSRIIEWDGTDDAGHALAAGSFLLRVSVDGHSESQIVYLTR